MKTTIAIPTDGLNVHGSRQGEWTVEDWERLPDDGNRYEIIEGHLYMTTAPSSFHQWIVQRLYRLIGIRAEDEALAFAFIAPIGVILPTGTAIQPDFLLVLKTQASIIRQRRIIGVPDLIVEVMSPGSAAYDEGIKLEACAVAGVPEYTVVDPANRQLRLYRLRSSGEYNAPLTYDEGDTLTFNAVPIALRVGDLFADAPDTTL